MSDLPSGWQSMATVTPAASPAAPALDLPEGWAATPPPPATPEPDRPDEVRAKAQIADTLAPRSSYSREAIASSTGAIGKLWTGVETTAQDLARKVRNTWQDMTLSSQRAQAGYKQSMGDDSPETEAQAQAVEAKQRALGPRMGFVPKFVMGMAYQLGYEGLHGAASIADHALSVLSAETLRHNLGLDPQTHFLTLEQGEADKVNAEIAGNMYRDARQRGFTHWGAWALSTGVGAAVLAVQAIPIGGEASGMLADAAAEGTIRSALKGSLDEALEIAVRDPGLMARTATALKPQAIFAAANATAQVVIPEIAAVVSNRLAGTSIRTKPIGQMAVEAGETMAGQMILGGGMVMAHEALRAIMQSRFEQAVGSAIDAQVPKQAPAAEAPAPRETAAKAETAEPTPPPEATKLADIHDEPFPVRELTPEGGQLLEPPKRVTKPGAVNIGKGAEAVQGMVAKQAAETAIGEERGRVASVKARNEAITGIYQVNPDLLNLDLGDAVRKIQDTFQRFGRTPKAELTDEKLGGLSVIHDALKNLPLDDQALRSPEIDLEALEKIAKGTPLRDLSVEDTQRVRNAVANIAHIQKVRDQVQDLQNAYQRQELEKLAQTQVKGMQVEKAGQVDGAPPSLGQAIEKLWRNMKGEGKKWFGDFSYNGLMLFHDKNNPLHKIAVENPYHASLEVEPYQAELKQSLTEWYKQRGINPVWHPFKYADYLMENFKADNPATGKPIEMNRRSIMSAYMHWKNETARANLLEGVGIKDSANPNHVVKVDPKAWQDLFSKLTPDEKAMLDKIPVEALTRTGDDMGKVFEERYGHPMQRPDAYWPIERMRVGSDGNFVEGWQDELEALQDGRRYVPFEPNKSHTITRTGGTGPMMLRGFDEVFDESLENSAYFVKMTKAAQEAGKVWFNPTISRRLSDGFGSKILNSQRDDLRVMSGQRQTQQGYENAFNFVGNLTSVLNLAGNVKSAIKQALLSTRSVPKVGPGAWFRGMARILKDPKGSSDYAASISQLYNNSLRRGATVEQAFLLGGGGAPLRKVAALRGMLIRGGMFLNRKGSQFSYLVDTIAADERAKIEIEGAADGHKFNDDFKASAGFDESSIPADIGAITNASGRYADTVIGETHASAARAQELGVQKYAVTRLLTKFKSEPFKAFQEMRRTIIQAHRNPTAFNIKKAIGTAVFYTIYEGVQFYGLDWVANKLYGKLAGTPKQQTAREPKLGEYEGLTNLNYLPGAGDVASAVRSKLKYPTTYGGSAAGQTGAILEEAITNIVQSQTAKTEKGRQSATQRLWWNAGDLASAVAGFSIRSARKVVQGGIERLEGK